ncbi:unnamed protein product [Brassica rapa subsp. narinosa]
MGLFFKVDLKILPCCRSASSLSTTTTMKSHLCLQVDLKIPSCCRSASSLSTTTTVKSYLCLLSLDFYEFYRKLMLRLWRG